MQSPTGDLALSSVARGPRERLSAADHRRLARRDRVRRELVGWSFLLPAGLTFVFLLLIPIIGVFWWSLRTGQIVGESQFVGLDNWANITTNAQALRSLGTGFSFALLAVPVTLVLAVLLAMVMQQVRRGGGLFRFFVYFPVLVPGAIVGLLWTFVTHPDGFLNSVLRLIGLPPQVWLSDALALPTLAAIEVWGKVGYWSLFFLAALIGLPKELPAAAELDGAGRWSVFRRITLPQLRPLVIFTVVLSTIAALQAFDFVYLLTRGGSIRTPVYYIFETVFQAGRVGEGATIATVLLGVILALTLTQMRLLRTRA